MPELPEVRTVAKVLKQKLINKEVTNLKIIYPKMIEETSLNLKSLIGKKLLDIKTKGKYLLFIFDDLTLISHLRMEGKYFIKDKNDVIEKHEHIIFEFNDISLRYHDTRKFGRMNLVKTNEIDKISSINKLAKEPFDITSNELLNSINKKNLPLKSILLDQTIINGLGNIYADEVLFASKLNPLIKGKNITKDDVNKIIESSIKILNNAIDKGGTTIKSYTSSLGVTGNYQNYLLVHKRENEKCKICNEKILRIKVGGRSTYYCPNCQKEKYEEIKNNI